jgi:hypothetical protein
MSDLRPKTRFLIPVMVVILAATTAEAGFVSVESGADHFIIGDSVDSFSSQMGNLSENSDDISIQDALTYLKDLTLEQLQAGNFPSSGGMTSTGSVSASGSSGPAAMLNEVCLPDQGLISRLDLREIPFTPQSLISDIFRPPCA